MAASESASKYRFKRFESSRDPDFAKALTLYSRETAPQSRTNSNEITSWVDGPPSDFNGCFSVFGFYRNGSLAGFAEAAYLNAPRIFVIDYVVLDPQHKAQNTFAEFAAHLRLHLEKHHPEYRYVVAEIPHGSQSPVPSHESRLLIRLLKQYGFHVVVAPYYQPRLDIDYAESELRSDLMLLSPSPIEEIRKETFFELVRAIYFDYYLPWMSHTESAATRYEKHLNEIFSRIKSQIKSNKPIRVNGHGLVMPIAPQTVQHEDHRILKFVAKGSGILVLMTGSLLAMKSAFRESDQAFEITFVCALIGILALAGIG